MSWYSVTNSIWACFHTFKNWFNLINTIPEGFPGRGVLSYIFCTSVSFNNEQLVVFNGSSTSWKPTTYFSFEIWENAGITNYGVKKIEVCKAWPTWPGGRHSFLYCQESWITVHPCMLWVRYWKRNCVLSCVKIKWYWLKIIIPLTLGQIKLKTPKKHVNIFEFLICKIILLIKKSATAKK